MKYQSLRNSTAPLLAFLLLLLAACSPKPSTTTQSPLLDSLSNRCFDLVAALQTDSLRTAAEAFIQAATPGSKPFFKAHQFYINSYFNAQKYDKVLSLLTATEQMPSFHNHPDIVCDYLYTRARALQYSKRPAEAIEAFKRCLTFVPAQEEQHESLLGTTLSAMTQLMNTYCASGRVEEGYLYYTTLKQHPSPVIRRFAMRDLYAHLGYLAIQSGHSQEAYTVTDSVFLLPLHHPTPEKLFRDYSYAAIVFYNHPDAKQRITQWLEQAMTEADKSGYTAGLEWSMNMLAEIYWQQNRVEEGIDLQYKALAMAQKRADKGAICYIYTDLCRLYRGWEMYPQANEFANHALETILPTENPHFISVACNAKAQVMQSMNLPDSAIYYYQQAAQQAEKSQVHKARLQAQNSIASLLIDFHRGDSLALGVQMAQAVLKNTHANDERSYYFYTLGKGLIKQGHTPQGEAMLDSMYADIARMPHYKYAEGVLEFVIDHYLAKGDCAKAMQYTAAYRKQVGAHHDEKISRKITSAMVQFQTEKKEQQLKLASAELRVKDLSIQLYLAALTLLLLLLIGGIRWYLHQHKLQKSRALLAEQEKLVALRDRELAEARLHKQQQQLNDALESLRDANLQSEQIQEQLNEFLQDQESKQHLAAITPAMFREKGEVKFRRYFTQLYPEFLPALKQHIADVTRGEEILCMLIALNQNMDEVADILCIEKKSVKMSRYRLRKKTGLEQEESLDDFIRNLLQSD